MSSSPKVLYEESLNDSWEEVSHVEVNPVSYFPGSGVENMLRDAQREGSESSVSRSNPSEHGSVDGGSRTPSPTSDDHPGLNILSTQSGIARRTQGSTDWIWDWSSRPDIQPPKKWKLHHPTPCLSIRNSKAKQTISNKIISVLILSNIMSLVVGIGIGIFIIKRVGSRALTSVLK